MLELEIDPKLAWALAHRARFPVDLNRAPKELLLRVPGLGLKAVGRIIQARRLRRMHAEARSFARQRAIGVTFQTDCRGAAEQSVRLKRAASRPSQ